MNCLLLPKLNEGGIKKNRRICLFFGSGGSLLLHVGFL